MTQIEYLTFVEAVDKGASGLLETSQMIQRFLAYEGKAATPSAATVLQYMARDIETCCADFVRLSAALERYTHTVHIMLQNPEERYNT